MADAGWSWFESDSADVPPEKKEEHDPIETARAFARTFQSADGQTVLHHLTALTLGRHLGPNASDAMLRYLEGQRQLVAYLTAMIERGGGQVASRVGIEQNLRKRKSLWTRIF